MVGPTHSTPFVVSGGSAGREASELNEGLGNDSQEEERYIGLRIELKNGATINCYDLKDDSFGFTFTNDGVDTKIRLSSEAVSAMHHLWLQLRNQGVIA